MGCAASAESKNKAMAEGEASEGAKETPAPPPAPAAPAAPAEEAEKKADEEKEEEKTGEATEDEEESDDEPPPGWFSDRLQGTMRKSVSAEAFGEHNKKTEFKCPVYPKDPEVKEKIQAQLTKSFLFASLEGKDFNRVTLAVQEVKFEAGDVIIKEGDDGDCLYIIEEGSPIVKKTIDGEEKVLKTCVPGDVFGELALLYNCPRAASVVSEEPSTCWKLDRGTFNAIVKDAAAKQRDRYQSFLKSVEILSELGDHEISQVADAMKVEKFSEGQNVITEGEQGDKLYIVEEGSLVAKTEKEGESKEVMQYKEGGYFGELSLLKDQPRAVSVVATSDVKVLSISRENFETMLGGLKDLLGKNAEKYLDLTK